MLPVGVEIIRPSATAVVRTREEVAVWSVKVRWVRCGEAPRWRISSLRAWRGCCEAEPGRSGGVNDTRRRFRRRIREVRVAP